ncbi:SMP-30/gluconolactonase/LRE family protein [Agarivorans sp. 1_MG-2023]|uniref:SMP-30/gluconolactonase/LRE family protein n=1 Tax=Agarivorans sp. 1_MG-2023 TaxID=3062634 RepID=UPI0026E17988|nr:SMP-30/gluconolactonase/LRE family protein [Agarivorans sp. 1_MG-2023]MDO6762617.1 SMP-30/gluconolactonase/LRE family protein [Agarivorans sp. 1_MG-2023]
MNSNPKVECIWPAQARLGEGVIWIEQEQALYWVDILKESLHRFHPASGQQQTWSQKPMISAILPTQIPGEHSTFVATYADGVKLLSNNISYPLIDPEPQLPNNRLNDAWVAPNGDLWLGSMDCQLKQDSGSFYRLSPDLKLNSLAGKYWVTNGPTFSASQAYGYFVDTENFCILRSKLAEDGSLINLENWLEIDRSFGNPDGITIDAEQHIWVAHYNGAQVSRYTPEGKLERQIAIPALNVTKCAFGGPDLSTLYVVTASEGMSEQQLRDYPLSGGVFAVELEGIRGVPTPTFAMTSWPSDL